jgi:hypothetical protein
MMGYTHGYAAGARDSLSVAMSKLQNGNDTLKDVRSDFAPDNITFGTLVEGVDACYGDFRNSRLDVDICADWTVMGIHGTDDEVRELFLQLYRKETSQ